jgi:hypothetical protein
MKKYEGVAVQLHTFLTSAFDGGDWQQCHALATLSAANKPWYSRLGRLHTRSGGRGEQKNHLLTMGN